MATVNLHNTFLILLSPSSNIFNLGQQSKFSIFEILLDTKYSLSKLGIDKLLENLVFQDFRSDLASPSRPSILLNMLWDTSNILRLTNPDRFSSFLIWLSYSSSSYWTRNEFVLNGIMFKYPPIRWFKGTCNVVKWDTFSMVLIKFQRKPSRSKAGRFSKFSILEKSYIKWMMWVPTGNEILGNLAVLKIQVCGFFPLCVQNFHFPKFALYPLLLILLFWFRIRIPYITIIHVFSIVAQHFFSLITIRHCSHWIFDTNHKYLLMFEEGVQIRVGHAPIFADAHRCASDAHQCAQTASIVKKIIFSWPKFCDFGLSIFIPEDG